MSTNVPYEGTFDKQAEKERLAFLFDLRCNRRVLSQIDDFLLVH